MSTRTTSRKPRAVLAFGPAFSPWLAATYEPLSDEFDIVPLTSDCRVKSPSARFVRTRHRVFRRLPGLFGVVAEQLTRRLWPDYNTISGLKKYLADADIVHTVETTSGPSLQVAKMKRRNHFRHVVTVWENIARRQSWHPRIRSVQARVIQSADHFIAVSERARTALMLEGVEPDRISVIGPGMAVPKQVERSAPTGSDFRFLFVGKKQRSKGVEELLLALWLARQDPELSHITLSLTFLGVKPSKGPYAELIRKYDLGKMITELAFVPHDDVMEHYGTAGALVIPSTITPFWQEQWGYVFMEAMSQGLPIVTTHSGSISEVAGKAALYARPNDHHSLYLCLKSLATSPAEWSRLSREGLAVAQKRFDARHAASKLQGVYQNLLTKVDSRGDCLE